MHIQHTGVGFLIFLSERLDTHAALWCVHQEVEDPVRHLLEMNLINQDDQLHSFFFLNL